MGLYILSFVNENYLVDVLPKWLQIENVRSLIFHIDSFAFGFFCVFLVRLLYKQVYDNQFRLGYFNFFNTFVEDFSNKTHF